MKQLNGSGHNEGVSRAPEEYERGRILRYPGVKRNTWAVGGGKGGVGKSLVASSFAIGLSKRGFKVLLIDADLGAPNLHTLIGMDGPRASFSSFLTGGVDEIGRVITRTPVPNLELISAARDPLDSGEMKKEGVKRLKQGLRTVEHDYIVLDLAPGTSFSVVELFNMAEAGVVVTTPEPTSIENTYRFLKCVFLGKMRRVINQPENRGLKELVGRAFGPEWKDRIKTFGDILSAVRAMDADRALFLKSAIEHTAVNVLVNKARSDGDEGLGGLIKRASRDYFNLDVGSIGSVRYEPVVMDSVARRRPLATHYDASVAALGIERCLDALLEKKRREAL